MDTLKFERMFMWRSLKPTRSPKPIVECLIKAADNARASASLQKVGDSASVKIFWQSLHREITERATIMHRLFRRSFWLMSWESPWMRPEQSGSGTGEAETVIKAAHRKSNVPYAFPGRAFCFTRKDYRHINQKILYPSLQSTHHRAYRKFLLKWC